MKFDSKPLAGLLNSDVARHGKLRPISVDLIYNKAI